MEGLLKTTETNENDEDFSFKNYFVPLTTIKAIVWIVVIGIFVYANMLFNGFVWDDKTYIIYNPDVQSFNFASLIGQSLFNGSGQYRPIPYIYFSTLFFFFRDISFFYHLFELGIHLSNTILLFLFLKKFFRQGLSFFLSLIFLIHPMQVESVSYIASSDNPIFFLFGLSALYLGASEKLGQKKIFFIFLLLLLSLFTKETGHLFIFVFLIFQFIFKTSRLLISIILSGVVLFIYSFARFFLGKVFFVSGELIPIDKLPLTERLQNVPAVFFYYLKTFFYPVTLSIYQLWVIHTPNIQNFYMPIFIELLFFFICGFIGYNMYKHNKKIFSVFCFFFIWFLGGMAFHSQIVSLDMTVADRWFYFPIVGLLGILGSSLQEIKVNTHYKKWPIIIGILLITLFSLRTMVRNTDWSDGLTLFTHDSKVEDNFALENFLGLEYGQRGNFKEALRHHLLSDSMLPREGNLTNTAYAYEQLGNNGEAKKYYYEALYAKTDFPTYVNPSANLYEGLLRVSLKTNDEKNAEPISKQALKLYPNDVSILIESAIIEYKLKNQSQALFLVAKAEQIAPTTQINNLYNLMLQKKSVDSLIEN